MRKKESFALWEQEGDLERMKLFFQHTDSGVEQKERIKQLTLDKIRLEEQYGTPVEPITETYSKRVRIHHRIQSMGRHWQWKFALPVAALVLIAYLGQAGMNGRLNFPLSQTNQAAQSQSMNQKGAASYDMVGAVPPDAGSSEIGAPSMLDKGIQDSRVEASSRQNAISPILPQPEPQTPPADESLPRKMTYNINVNLQVEDIELAVERITDEVKNRGGFVVESSQDQYQKNTSAQATVKIPSDQLEGFRELLPSLGSLLSLNTTANDITNQYYDAETRLRSWEAQESRYLEILEEAKTVEEILQIENYLGNIRMQIEQLKGQLKLWDHEVSYSTVQISFQTTPNPVKVDNPWQPVAWSKTWQAARDAVLKTLSSSWNGINYLFVGIAYATPYLLLLVMLYGVYKGVKKYRK